MIRSFRDRATSELFAGRFARGVPPDLQRRAHLKLLAIHAATDLATLAAVPANRLERLRGERTGQWSLRVNDQWRICFRWDDGDAVDVEFVDYHR